MGRQVAVVVALLLSCPLSAEGRLLVPIFYNGPGAYGTEWRSEYVVWVEDVGLLRDVRRVAPTLTGVWLDTTGTQLARVVRVYEARSHAPSALVPIVAESQFRREQWVPMVPAGSGRVVTLRVYSLAPTAVTVNIAGSQRLVRTVAGADGQPAFGSLDLSDLSGEQELMLQSNGALIWAMTSTFDLVTGELFIRTPPQRPEIP